MQLLLKAINTWKKKPTAFEIRMSEKKYKKKPPPLDNSQLNFSITPLWQGDLSKISYTAQRKANIILLKIICTKYHRCIFAFFLE